MALSFRCEKCSKILSANERAAGREITCPYCRQTTTIPALSQDRDAESFQEDSSPVSNKQEDEPSTANAEGFVKCKGLNGLMVRFVDDDFDPFEASREADAALMREIIPDFKPNPFSCAHPFDEAAAEYDESEFEEEQSGTARSEALDDPNYVDKLIEGFGED